MTELREGDLVQASAKRQVRYWPPAAAGEVGLIVELKEDAFTDDGPRVGVVWPHVATIRWYWTTDLVKVAG